MRIVIIVLDSAGIGAAPDAGQYGDIGSNTIHHSLQATPQIQLINLERLGLKQLIGLPPTEPLLGQAYKVHPMAKGKDTLTGHWEMMGVVLEQPFQTYPNGFPADVMQALQAAFQRPILGNEVASGTEIIARLGAQHIATGWPIVYTSADSVLQIAAHEKYVPLNLQYEWCEAARKIMQGPQLVGRIIARPFTGENGNFIRTPNRHDFTVDPPIPTVVEELEKQGVYTVAVGKIGDIFSNRGFKETIKTKNNEDGLEQTKLCLEKIHQDAFIFTNLVDFDSKYGHRRNPEGYAKALETVDQYLPKLYEGLNPEDQIWITADHGCDPTFKGTDHTREDVPWLIYGQNIQPGLIGERFSMSDMAATLAGLWNLPYSRPYGHPLEEQIKPC